MAITNKLITFNKLTSFETQLAQGNILETSIVFIKDAKKIWTKGTYFDCSGGGSNNIAVYETTDAIYSGELTFTQELLDLITNERIHNIIIISSIGVKAFFPFHRESYSANRSQFDCIVSKIWYSIIVEPISGTYQLLRRDLALKSDIPNTDNFATQANLTSAVTQLTTNIAKKQNRFKINGRTINLDEDIEVAELDLGANGRYTMADGMVDAEDNYYSLPSNPDNYGDANILATKADIPNTDDFATKDEIGYTTEFSVADIEAVYVRGITKPINVQGLVSAIEANRPIIIPTNITDASGVGGNAVTMAKMDYDGYIYLNVIVPYLDGVHKEYFIQIKITTAQLIKSGSNGSITLKELVAKDELTEVEEVWAAYYNLLIQKISDVQQFIYDEAASRRQFDEAIVEIQSIIAENEAVTTAAWNQLNTRINALEAAQRQGE